MKYTYNQGKDGAWIEEYSCRNYFCEGNCECGLEFEEVRDMVISYYNSKLERAMEITEENWMNWCG